MSILDKFLKKKGIEKYEDLNTEEQETYRQWEEMLVGRRLTDQEIEKFFIAELDDVLDKIPKQIDGSRNDMFLKMKLDFIRSVQRFLALPKTEKEMAEKTIESMIASG